MSTNILNKYSGYYVGTDLEGNSIPVKSWTFKTEADFQRALDQGYIINDGSLIWITGTKEKPINQYYKVINGQLKILCFVDGNEMTSAIQEYFNNNDIIIQGAING